MKTFEELQLIKPVQRALAEEQYTTPTPIQARTIPAALEGQDILGCAQTGTGKTAAFALPILNRLGRQTRKAIPNRPLALVLAPTRELAIQIAESFNTYGRHLRLRICQVFGGVSQVHQVRVMKRGAHVLVATPGRLLDLMEQGHIELDELDVFVLDEADRMLDMGFLPDLKRIISRLPAQRQSLFFSATMPPRIVELSRRLLTDPVSVDVTPKKTSVKRIDQSVMFVDKRSKRTVLQRTLTSDSVQRALVFTRTKRGANVLARQLVQDGFKATAIHGNKSQNARQRALEALRQNEIQILVATDVAARGIDIDGITHVVNYDLPMEPESYVHRIGRTGRAGAEGVAVSFCTVDERRELRAIERLIGQSVRVEGDVPQEDSRPRRDARPARQQTSRNGQTRRRPNRRTDSGSSSEQAQQGDRGTSVATTASSGERGSDGASGRPRRRRFNRRRRDA